MKISIAVATVMAAIERTIFQRSESPRVDDAGVATRWRTSDISCSSLEEETTSAPEGRRELPEAVRIRVVEGGRGGGVFGPRWGM
jgi:hypothetical protein